MGISGQSSTTQNVSPSQVGRSEVATLGGGCFWCLEAVYDQLKGVISVESGYSNGHVVNPSYRQVCNGDTGHAEVVAITFDPSVITFRDLLDVFFTVRAAACAGGRSSSGTGSAQQQYLCSCCISRSIMCGDTIVTIQGL